MELSIITKGHNRIYELENMIRACFTNCVINFSKTTPDNILSVLKDDRVYTVITIDGKEYKGEFKKDDKKPYLNKLGLMTALSFARAYDNYKKFDLPWGVLVGIRPSKKVSELLNFSYNKEEILKILTEDFLIKKNKAELIFKVDYYENKIIEKMDRDKASIYIGIPYCPTRCAYCSFISKPSKKVPEEYLEALIKEIEYFNIFSGTETIYIGGGTPTTLSDYQLEKLLYTVNNKFGKVKEFTVEAGRPDTITKEKLKVLKKYNVDRISINPQSLNDKTLKEIGRNHTAEDFRRAFSDAKDIGFNSVNCDLIAGLSNENLDDFKNTLDEIYNLSPENITIHTLSYKRASIITRGDNDNKFADKMQNYGAEKLKDYMPYYLYRQKNTLDNLENVGYTKEGYPCLYNVYMMGELQNIISFGGGAVTKLVTGDKTERIRNPKSPEQYISNIESVINKKDEDINEYFNRK